MHFNTFSPKMKQDISNKKSENFFKSPLENQTYLKKNQNRRIFIAIALYILLLFSFAFSATMSTFFSATSGQQGYIEKRHYKVELTDGNNRYDEKFMLITLGRAVPNLALTRALQLDFIGTSSPVYVRFALRAFCFEDNQAVDIKYNMNFSNPESWAEAEVIDGVTYYLYKNGLPYQTNPLENDYVLDAVSDKGILIDGPKNTLEEIGGKSVTIYISIQIIGADEDMDPISNYEFSSIITTNN